eukprot:6427-Heterococcus_DN1.PRE.5
MTTANEVGCAHEESKEWFMLLQVSAAPAALAVRLSSLQKGSTTRTRTHPKKISVTLPSHAEDHSCCLHTVQQAATIKALVAVHATASLLELGKAQCMFRGKLATIELLASRESSAAAKDEQRAYQSRSCVAGAPVAALTGFMALSFGATAKFAAAAACWRCNALSIDAWLQREAILIVPPKAVGRVQVSRRSCFTALHCTALPLVLIMRIIGCSPVLHLTMNEYHIELQASASSVLSYTVLRMLHMTCCSCTQYIRQPH